VPRAVREEQMLDAAGAAFAQRGFHAASMDEIALAAGISKPMLYQYFGSKDGLYVAYVQRSGRALLERMRAAEARDAPVRERLRAGIGAFLAYVDEHRSGWAVLYHEAATHGGPVATLRDRIAGTLTPVFDGGAGDGRDGEMPAEALAHAFVGAGESMANWWLEHPETPMEDVVALLLRLAEASLAPEHR
jgi:AcrR family transcriptional regulator